LRTTSLAESESTDSYSVLQIALSRKTTWPGFAPGHAEFNARETLGLFAWDQVAVTLEHDMDPRLVEGGGAQAQEKLGRLLEVAARDLRRRAPASLVSTESEMLSGVCPSWSRASMLPPLLTRYSMTSFSP